MAQQIRAAEWRLRFALRFAFEDIKELRRGDELNLRDDLKKFLGERMLVNAGEPRVMALTPVVDVDRMTAFDLEHLRERVMVLLEDRFVKSPAGALTLSQEVKLALSALPLDIHDGKSIAARGTILSLGGSVEDCFLTLLGLALAGIDAVRVRQCPECKKLFYRVGTQRYCSKKCTNRVGFRAWYDRKKKRKKKPRRRRRG